jgi:WD40 repeat protein
MEFKNISINCYIITGHTSGILVLDFLPSKKNIVTESDDKTIKVWNSTNLIPLIFSMSR